MITPQQAEIQADWLRGVLYQLIHIDGDVLRYDAYAATGQLFDTFALVKGPDGTSSVAAQ